MWGPVLALEPLELLDTVPIIGWSADVSRVFLGGHVAGKALDGERRTSGGPTQPDGAGHPVSDPMHQLGDQGRSHPHLPSAHAQVVLDRQHTEDFAGGPARYLLVALRADRTGQRDTSVLDDDVDRRMQ